MPETLTEYYSKPDEDPLIIEARKRIEKVREELIDSGESPEDADRWLQPHIDDLLS